MAKGKRAPGGAGGTVAVCARLAQPVAEELGLVLWDVRFVKEGATWYLRYIIDKEEGVSIDDCVEMSRRLNPILDEADPIPQAYCMEVSSCLLYTSRIASAEIRQVVEIPDGDRIAGQKIGAPQVEQFL